MEGPVENHEQEKAYTPISRRTVILFTIFFILAMAAVFGWRYLASQPHDIPEDRGVQKPEK